MAINPLTSEIAVKVLCGGFFEYCTILMLQKHELLPVHKMYTTLSKVQMKVFFCDVDCVKNSWKHDIQMKSDAGNQFFPLGPEPSNWIYIHLAISCAVG